MGFNKMFGASPNPPTVSTPPPTVTETVESDMQADYAQRASRRRGLLSTILTNRHRVDSASVANPSGNSTLG